MHLMRSLPLVAATVMLAAQAGLKAGTTMVVVPRFPPPQSYGGPAVALAQAGSSAVAQTQAPPSVTFQVEVNYVDVDAIVTDEQGNFVSGLTREDFEVFEDGKPQKVEMFSYVELPVERPDRFRRARSSRHAPTCARMRGRSTDGSTCWSWTMSTSVRSAPPSSRSRRASSSSSILAPTISRPSCIPAAAPMPRRTSRTTAILLIASVDKFVGRRLQSAAIEALEKHYYRRVRPARSSGQRSRCGCRHHRHGVADQRAGSRARAACARGARHAPQPRRVPRRRPGRRKAVLLFSEGLELPMSELYSMHTPTDVGGAIRDAITAAARSNVNFFALDPRGPHWPDDRVHRARGIGCARRGDGRVRIANAQQGLLNDIRLSQEQPAYARRRNRWICRRQPEHARICLRAHRRREQPVLRARLLPAHLGTRRPVSSDRGAHETARACACRRAAVTPRRAAARPPSESATKRRGGRARPDAAASTTRRPSCATRSTPRCSRAA